MSSRPTREAYNCIRGDSSNGGKCEITPRVYVTNFPSSQTVDGSVSVSYLPAISGNVCVNNLPTTQTVNGKVAVSSLPAITGSVAVNNFPSNQTVNGTVAVSSLPAITGSVAVNNFPSKQTVNGTVSVSSLPAITGNVRVTNFPATQPVNSTVSVSSLPAITGSVAVNNFPASQPVTGTFFQTTQPVSGTVDIGNYPALTDVNITSQSASVYVDIGSSCPLDISSLPPIAITNSTFAATNTSTSALYVRTVLGGSAFNVVVSGPVTTINTTTAVSITTIDVTSDQIKASGSGTITTMTLSSNLLAATLGTINFVKFYNSPTATNADTPILKVGLLSNQSLTIDANISFTNGCCVRASVLWADNDTIAPTENITGAFFLRV